MRKQSIRLLTQRERAAIFSIRQRGRDRMLRSPTSTPNLDVKSVHDPGMPLVGVLLDDFGYDRSFAS
jgi:hypothetical protein